MDKVQYKCQACGNPITHDMIIKDTFPYHVGCIKCLIKGCPSRSNINDYETIQPGLFLCHPHYLEFLNKNGSLPPYAIIEYKKKSSQTIIEKAFEPPPIMKNAICFNDHVKIFLPTIEFHFEKRLDLLDLTDFQEFIGDEFVIIDAGEGSSKIILAKVQETLDDVKKKTDDVKKIVDTVSEIVKNISDIVDALKPVFKFIKEKAMSAFARLKELINSESGKKKVGKVLETPIETYPTAQDFNNFINNNANNSLQVNLQYTEKDVYDLCVQISNTLKQNRFSNKFNSIKEKKIIGSIAEQYLTDKIENCQYEIVNTNKYFTSFPLNEDYENAKKKFDYSEIQEFFLYHGCYSNLELQNDEDYLIRSKRLQYDGYYTTDNIFYATFYGNEKFHPLNVNEKALVVVCKAFCNKDYLQNIFPSPKSTYDSIIQNDGALHIEVGNEDNNFLPLDTRNQSKEIFANEFIFGKNYQLQQLFTLEVIRRDSYVLWKDPDIDRKAEQVEKLKRAIESNENLYLCKDNEKAESILKKKIINKVKIIINEDVEFISKVREIFKSNFILLVYSANKENFDTYNKMENVLFTTSFKMVKLFVKMDFSIQSINNYVTTLSDSEKVHFDNFNIDEAARFQHYSNEIKFDDEIIFQPEE